LNRANILLIANETEFATNVVSRWQTERDVPVFTLLSSELWMKLLGSELSGVTPHAGYDLVIVGPLDHENSATFLRLLDCLNAPVIHMTREAARLRTIEFAGELPLLIPERDGWLDELIQLSNEILRRVEAERTARSAEKGATASQQHAVLGRYMLDVQYNISNIITSVLGNAELLLSEPLQLPGHVLLSIDTVQGMALRLREIMQRFSSLASELRFAEKESQDETLDGTLRPVEMAEFNSCAHN
jgi:signal transduction histidine kinase